MSPLQLDLATVVGRLAQVRDEYGGDFAAAGIIAERLITCDLPRLEGHLDSDAQALLAEPEDPYVSMRPEEFDAFTKKHNITWEPG